MKSPREIRWEYTFFRLLFTIMFPEYSVEHVDRECISCLFFVTLWLRNLQWFLNVCHGKPKFISLHSDSIHRIQELVPTTLHTKLAAGPLASVLTGSETTKPTCCHLHVSVDAIHPSQHESLNPLHQPTVETRIQKALIQTEASTAHIPCQSQR